MAKKLGPVAWILLGCGGVILVIGIAFVALGVFAVGKARQFAEDIQDNPVAAAEMVVRLNPDLDVVSKDEAGKKLTLRQRSTGDEFTIDASKILDGELSFTNSKGEVVRFDAQAGQGESVLSATTEEGSFDVTAGGTEGAAVITSRDAAGTTTSQFGGDAGLATPDWLPLPSVERMEGAFATDAGGVQRGGVRIWSDDTPADFVAAYRDRIEQEGFEVSMASESAAGWMLQAEDSSGRSVLLAVQPGASVQGTLTYSEKTSP